MSNRQYKVLFVIDTLEIGGAEQSLLENAIRFTQITPIVCHLYRGDTLKSKFIKNDIKVLSLNIESKLGFLQAFEGLSKIVTNEKPCLLVAYLTRSELVARAVSIRYSIPIIGTFVSDLYSSHYNKSLSLTSRFKVKGFRLLNKISAKVCCGFVANSKGIKESNSRKLGISEEKIKVIYRGRSSEIFKYKDSNGAGRDVIKFLNVGRLFPVKGQKELILAFKKFHSVVSNSYLDIIGEGPSRNELTDIIRQNELEGKVRLLGARYDMHDLMQEYDCFVFPSYSEGFSGSVIEAMFSGIPVLASDITANKEAIQHLETGYLFNSGSVSAIEEAMHWFNKNMALAQLFAKSAKGRADRKFELSNIAREFEDYLLQKIK